MRFAVYSLRLTIALTALLVLFVPAAGADEPVAQPASASPRAGGAWSRNAIRHPRLFSLSRLVVNARHGRDRPARQGVSHPPRTKKPRPAL